MYATLSQPAYELVGVCVCVGATDTGNRYGTQIEFRQFIHNSQAWVRRKVVVVYPHSGGIVFAQDCIAAWD